MSHLDLSLPEPRPLDALGAEAAPVAGLLEGPSLISQIRFFPVN
jgi:hypothetical protein